MGTQFVKVVMPERPIYGARTLKEYINKATMRGFIISASVFAAMMLGYLAFANIDGGKKKIMKMAPIQKIKLENLPPADNDAAADAAPPPPTQTVINHGPAARAGTPVPVPDADISEDMKDFATVDVMDRASAEGGDGIDNGDFAADIDFDDEVKVEVREEEPAPDEFIAVEKEPGVQISDLQKLVEYPDVAIRAGVEGTVFVRALISKAGKMKKCIIEESDNALLNDAAMSAVKKYKGFTPAIQNGQPVQCWVSIPIEFKLR